MDAKITKQRLGNMFSYDWIKMLVSIAAAVAALVILFTMVGTRPTRAQKFYIHAYGSIVTGTEFSDLSDRLPGRLSYDVLEVQAQSFGTGYLDSASYTARRSSGEGSVMFVADYAKPDDEGNVHTPFDEIVEMGMRYRGTAEEELNLFYDLGEYFSDLETYLARFFGENWRESDEIDRAEAEKCFRARNVDGPNNGHRYKTGAQIASGIEDEIERLTTLRKDYLFLLESGLGTTFPYVEYVSPIETAEGEAPQENVYRVGINLGKLANIENLVRYADAEGNRAHAKITFLIYHNRDSKLDAVFDDLKYEAVSFLAFVVEQYA